MQLSKNLSLKEATRSQTVTRKGISNEPAWVHCSYTKNNRKEVLRAKRENGKVIYSVL